MNRADVLDGLREEINQALDKDGVVILPPMDVFKSCSLMRNLGFSFPCTMVDPWYNKGVGGVQPDYDDFICRLLKEAAQISQHLYLWGFPEIIARFIDRYRPDMELTCWLTWYYKNNPSVIRGWRSAQMTCLHLSRPGAKLYPEHFLNEAQKEKQAQGKLRYMPGPPSVIEESLLVGFVGRKEQTGHPAQKPVRVYNQLLMMVTQENDVCFDPMCGSGTTGESARMLGRKAILCDHSEEYTNKVEHRLGVKRLHMLETLLGSVDQPQSQNHFVIS